MTFDQRSFTGNGSVDITCLVMNTRSKEQLPRPWLLDPSLTETFTLHPALGAFGETPLLPCHAPARCYTNLLQQIPHQPGKHCSLIDPHLPLSIQSRHTIQNDHDILSREFNLCSTIAAHSPAIGQTARRTTLAQQPGIARELRGRIPLGLHWN